MSFRGARAAAEAGASIAREQKNADQIAAKAQRIRKAAAAAKQAKDLADGHENELSSGVLRTLNIGEMALLNRINGELPNQNFATLEDATKIGTGVVAARTLISQDAASFNLWAQNAMIRSAAIQNLVVDKLSAGSFTAGTISLVGNGRIGAGRTKMDSAGIEMGNHDAGDTGSVPGDLSIKNPQGTTNIWSWFTASKAGITVRADPLSGREAALFLGAFSDSTSLIKNEKSASIELYAGTQGTASGARMDLNSPVFMRDGWKANAFRSSASIPANGGVYTIGHGQGTSALFVFAQVAEGAGQWRDISFKTNLFVDWVSDLYVRIVNNTSTNQAVRTFIYKLSA